MSSFGFRSSLFGFNKDDVNLYLMKIRQEYANKEQELKFQLDKSDSQLEALKEKCDQLLKDMEKMKGELEYFKGKEAEIEKMSISIGTMYLMAKQNADQMISAAEDCAKEINDFSRRQLDAAEKAGQQLKAIRESVSTSADKFTEEISSLSSSLEDSKNRLGAELERITNTQTDIFISDGNITK